MTREDSVVLEVVDTSVQPIAVRRRGAGPPIVFVHGNSCSSRSYDKQLTSRLADRFQLLAIDLPGHGDSPPAPDPSQAYSLPGHARAVAAVTSSLGVGGAVFVGWSLGGHVLLEAAHLLPRAAGFLIFGTPPIASFGDFLGAATDDPALHVAFRGESSDEEVNALLRLFFRPNCPIPQQFIDDIRRTDPSARAFLAASADGGQLRDEIEIVGAMKAPLAVFHGSAEQVVKRAYFDKVSMPSLWRGTVQDIPDAGHAPHWENPAAFNDLLEAFALECMRSA